MRKFLVYGLLLLAACNKGETYELSFRNFEEEISPRQNLVFTFNADIQETELQGQWLEEAYIDFSPEVDGKFRWNNPNELVFSPSAGFAPSTAYTARFTDKLETALGKTAAAALKQPLTFHTPYVQVENTQALWALNAQSRPELQLAVNFNYPVATEAVAKLLSVEVNGKPQTYTMASAGYTNTVQLALPNLQATEKELPLKVKLAGGLTIADGARPAGAYENEMEVPAKERFQIVQILPEQQGSSSLIRVYTNQAVSSKRIEELVSLSPSVKTEVEPTDFGFLLRGNFAPAPPTASPYSSNCRGCSAHSFQKPTGKR